jgi:hypothetical protein
VVLCCWSRLRAQYRLTFPALASAFIGSIALRLERAILAYVSIRLFPSSALSS